MKLSECDARQRKAFINIKYACPDLCGCLENTMYDYPEDSEEYKNAKATLEDHNALVTQLYDMAISAVYTEDCCYFGSEAERTLRDIRFCGKEWLMARCNARLLKEGY